MKKILFIVMAVSLITAVTIYAQSLEKESSDDMELAKLESLAEHGDTAAMHRLIEFYGNEVTDIVDTDVVEVNSNELVDEFGDSIIVVGDTADVYESHMLCSGQNEYFETRLNYWLDKGVAMNDPVALATKGMRLYYEDEAQAIPYLSRAADAGNAQAALFCGSACLNHRRGNEAFKYLSLAYRLGVPSAGWHLAMCYFDGIGTTPNIDKAIEVMRHAAILNYPEAVLEMRRIEPDNIMWRHKSDSLELDFPLFYDYTR